VSSRTPSQVAKAQRRADVARTLARVLLAHDVTDREVAAATGVAHQHVAEWRDPDSPRSMPFADALALPQRTRLALAELVAGPGHVVAEVPEGDPSASIAHALEVQRETAEVITAHLAAIADGHVSRDEAVRLRAEIAQAMRVLVSLDRACAIAERDGVVSTSERH
jgi:hypothetical protein